MDQINRLIGRHDLRLLTSLSVSQVNRLEARGLFPKRIALGQRRVAWCLREVEDWIQSRIAAREGGCLADFT